MAIEKLWMKQGGRWQYDSDESRLPNSVVLGRAYTRLWARNKTMSDAEARYHEVKSTRSTTRPR